MILTGLLPTPNANLDMQERMLEKGNFEWNRKNKHSMTLPQALSIINHHKEETEVTVKLSTYSPAASRNLASRSPVPDKEKDRAMTVSSGLRCLKRLGLLPRVGLLAKTFLDCLVRTGGWYSSVCALTWKMKVTKFNRLLFQLAPSTRPTDGTGFGSLPTVRASMRAASKKEIALGDPKKRLETRIAVIGANTGTKLRLEPAMCEWMMGFPEGWTELTEYPPNPRTKHRRGA